MTTRVVFDCMVFVQALANEKGPAYACFQLAQVGRIDLCVSLEILAEVRDVLNRPKLQKKLPAITPERIEAFLTEVVRYATIISDVPRVFLYERDPKDEPYINLAIIARARYLTSRDNDLLDLMSDETFRLTYPDLIVLDPVGLLRELSVGEERTPDS